MSLSAWSQCTTLVTVFHPSGCAAVCGYPQTVRTGTTPKKQRRETMLRVLADNPDLLVEFTRRDLHAVVTEAGTVCCYESTCNDVTDVWPLCWKPPAWTHTAHEVPCSSTRR